MKQDLKLICLVLVGATTLLLLLPCVSTAQLPVPYYEQRHGIGPLSWSDMAYVQRLVEQEDDSMEVTTNAGEAEGSDAWDNSCVSEPVNAGGFSVEEEVKESDGTIQEDV
ncbi:uncharacterized protein LOC128719364 [Anopheles marshallii]|uniref:uncharacterized protein LOC128719364 n=1 Tax=Anopheles marshallii TaxID=1521116 RepID=UPI00237ABC20|nr:uncharacterized protein LOC128719364 [Anopheles marshallii]